MVKKIRVIDEQESAESLDEADFKVKMLTFLEQIDWKLWELLKIEQARDASSGTVQFVGEVPKPSTTYADTQTSGYVTTDDIQEIIVDEEDADIGETP